MTEDMSKTDQKSLGQIAYEAYFEEYNRLFGTSIDSSIHVSDHSLNQMWEAVANAVKEAVLGRMIGDACLPECAATELERLRRVIHIHTLHPDYEYATMRHKLGSQGHPPEGEGWEPNEDMAGGWELFEFHKETYWRRKKSAQAAPYEASPVELLRNTPGMLVSKAPLESSTFPKNAEEDREPMKPKKLHFRCTSSGHVEELFKKPDTTHTEYESIKVPVACLAAGCQLIELKGENAEGLKIGKEYEITITPAQ